MTVSEKPKGEVLGRDVDAWTPEIELAASRAVEALVFAGAAYKDDSEAGEALADLMEGLCYYRRMKKLAGRKNDHFDGYAAQSHRQHWLHQEPYIPTVETKKSNG